MTEIEIVKELFVASSSNSTITVILNDNSTRTGHVAKFDGASIELDGEIIQIASILTINKSDSERIAMEDNEPQPSRDFSEYKSAFVHVCYSHNGESEEIEGVLFDYKNNKLVIVTDTAKIIIKEKDVYEITAATKQNCPESQLSEVVFDSNYVLNGFEQALFDGKKDKVDGYLADPSLLESEGYSEEEAVLLSRIGRVPLNWEDNELNRVYNQARRVYSYLKNRNHIAEVLFNQYINSEKAVPKLKAKALSTLIDILEKESPDKLIELYHQQEAYIKGSQTLCSNLAHALFKTGRFDLAKEVINTSTGNIDFSDVLFSLNYFEKYSKYDFSTLPGLDSLDSRVTFKELKYIFNLPDKFACIQLLNLYNRNGRTDSFFALLSMFMPMAREDQQINYLVSECLKKESVEKYLSEYLPQFPLLWLDPILMQKYVSLQLVEVTDDRTRRLLSFSKRACMYSLPNELENTIIKENYQLFDVLRGNDSILHPLGYTTEEETKIKEIDIEALRYGNKPVIEKLLLLEGNRNFVPESMAGMDFLRDPVSVCSLLFPIQIHDGHGELVFELYNYSTRIKNKLDSLKKYYLNALLLLDEKDEYWELIKDNWLKMDLDNEMLKKSRDIADAKGETEVAELLHLYSQIQPLNDLEKALITGNIFKLRTIATDADSLLASGYTSDDIKLIQESVRQKIDFRAEDYLSIANRLYLYQKNKNRTAELYYKLALHENNNMAVPGLFAIYARENRYEELCKLFEAHIDDSSLSNTTNNNTAYLNALYQTKQYQKFYAFWIAKKDSSAIDQIILLTVLLEIKAPSKAVEENVFNSQFSVTEDNRSFAKECLIRFADQTQSQTQGSLIKLYNLSFPVFTTQDLSDIRLAYKQATFDGFTEPEGIGIASLTTDITTDKIREWVEYLFGFSGDDQNKINIIRNVDWLYKKETEEYHYFISSLLSSVDKRSIGIPEELKPYLYPWTKGTDDIIYWLDEKITSMDSVDASVFDIFCDLAHKINDTGRLHKFVCKLSSNHDSFSARYIEETFALLAAYLSSDEDEAPIQEIIQCIQEHMCSSFITADEMIMLYNAYLKTHSFEYAYMADIVLNSSYQLTELQVVTSRELRTSFTTIDSFTIFGILEKQLSSDDILSIDHFCRIWSKYLKISDDDATAFEEIKDLYNQPEKWTEESLNALAKHLICNPSSFLYWNLIKIFYADGQLAIKYCIAYHLYTIEGRMLDTLILKTSENNLQHQTITIITNVIKEEHPESVEKYKDAITVVIHNHPEWFYDKDTANEFLSIVDENGVLHNDLQAWNTIAEIIMEISFLGKNERAFYEQYKSELESELSTLNEKFLCKLILSRSEDTDLINKSFEHFTHTKAGMPFKEMLAGILGNSPYETRSDTELEILQIICANRGVTIDNLALYRYYVSSVAGEKRDLALAVFAEIEKYYPDLDIIDDVKKYELLSSDINDNDILRIYESEFDQLRTIHNPQQIEKTVMNMIPAEMYLKSQGIELTSALEYGLSSLSPMAVQEIKKRVEYYRSLDNVFDQTRYPGLVNLFLKCSFIRQWQDVINYQVDDTSIDDIVRNDSSIKFIFEKKTYDILKSGVLSILNASADNARIIDRVDAIFVAGGGIKRSKNYLRRILNMNEDEKALLRRIFSLRVESKTLRQSGIIGSTILQIPQNEELAFVIGMYETSYLVHLFNNDACHNALLMMPSEKALEISTIYSSFFYKGASNVFTQFIYDHSQDLIDNAEYSNPFEANADNCKETRNRYQKLKARADESAGQLPKLAVKNLAYAKVEYLYEAVIYRSDNDLYQINPSATDYLSVITYLFNRKSTAEMREYIWKLDSVYLVPMLAMVLTLLEQYVMAYEAANRIEQNSWREAIQHILQRYLNYGSLSAEEKNIRDSINKQTLIDKTFFIGKFVPVAPDQVPAFVQKTNSLWTFCNELLEYLAFNGIDTSWVVIDEEKQKALIARYTTSKDSTVAENKIITQPNENVVEESISSIASRDYIVSLLATNNDIAARDSVKLSAASFEDTIGVLKGIIESKRGSVNTQDIIRCRDVIRWTYIKQMEREGYSRESFNHVLEFISEKDLISKSQWDAIFAFLLKYFDKITDIQQLSRVIENDITYLQNIGKISNKNINFLRPEDIKSWWLIIEVLSLLAGIDYIRTPENDQITRLSMCRGKLFANGESRTSSTFDPISNCILRLITDHIVKLRHNPELNVSFIGADDSNQQVVQWESGNNVGHLYAVISNIGGADCQQVALTSTINMTKIRKCFIKKLYSGEKIPFTETFKSSDLVDGNVTWTIDISYYDSDKEQQIASSYETKASIQKGGEPLNLGNINATLPAQGKNFVGRKRELAQLRNRYTDIDQMPSMLIRGLKRSGKSSIIHQFADELRKRKDLMVAFVDGQSISGNIKKAFVDKVLESLKSNYRLQPAFKEIFNEQFDQFFETWDYKMDQSTWIENLDTFYAELNTLFGRKILVIIDEMEAIFYEQRFESVDQEESLYAALRAQIQKPENYVAFIFCGSDKLLTSCLEQRRESQMFQTLQYIEVGHMNYNDIQEIFRLQSARSDIIFSQDAISTIWQYTNGLVWYAKLLGYLVINNILANDLAIRNEVNRSDIVTAVQMLINGELGTDKYDLILKSMSTSRAAIVHAMAGLMPDMNKELSVDEISAALELLRIEGYTNPINGETVPFMNEKDLKGQLDLLEKMQYIDSNPSKTRFMFTADLYRLFFRDDKKLHLFEERSL